MCCTLPALKHKQLTLYVVLFIGVRRCDLPICQNGLVRFDHKPTVYTGVKHNTFMCIDLVQCTRDVVRRSPTHTSDFLRLIAMKLFRGCSFILVGRFRLVSHKGSDILTLDPVYPYGCGEVLKFVGGGVVDLVACLMVYINKTTITAKSWSRTCHVWFIRNENSRKYVRLPLFFYDLILCTIMT